MPKPLLLVITGLPCTGKTTLGRYLATELNLPFVHKDGIKETLFDSLGWSDREWSRKLGGATYDLLYYTLETLMQAGVSLVVESNFEPERAEPKLRGMIQLYQYEVAQVLCKADGAILVERFRARAESGERHPGHVDTMNYDEMETQLRNGRIEPLSLAGPLLEIDTSDFDVVDYGLILQSIRDAITSQKENRNQL